MPIAWVDVPDPKNPPAGAPALSAANLARLALVEDIGTTGTPTGDALKAAIATLPAGTTITVLKDPTTGWPARPTSRADLVVAWKGADPSPAIVSSGTGGMLNGVDYRLVTP